MYYSVCTQEIEIPVNYRILFTRYFIMFNLFLLLFLPILNSISDHIFTDSFLSRLLSETFRIVLRKAIKPVIETGADFL